MSTKRLMLLFSIMVIASSCGKLYPDDRSNYLPEDKVYLNNSAVRQNVPVSDGQYQVVIIKGGVGQSEADVTVALDQAFLSEYNSANETSYQIVPSNIIDNFSSVNVHFTAEEDRQIVSITWNPSALAAYLSLGKYVIPISISCDDLTIVEGRNRVLIYPTL